MRRMIVSVIFLLCSSMRLCAALSSATGTFNIGTGAATTTVAVTGLGFTPKVVFFWWSGRTEATDTFGRATHIRGFGATTGASNNVSAASRSLDAAAAAAADGAIRSDACILETGDGTMEGWADLQSFDAGGFTLEILDQFTTDLRVGYLALGGTTISNAITGLVSTPADVGAQNITDSGFQPDAVLFFSSRGGASAPPANGTDSTFLLGFASGASNEAGLTAGSNDAATTIQTAGYGYSGESVVRLDTSAAGANIRAEFTQFTANGFDLNWLETASGFRFFYVALATGGNVSVGTVTTQTDTTTDITVSGLSFTPKAILFASAGRAQSTQDTPTDRDVFSIGAGVSASSRNSSAVYDQDAVADSVVATALETDAVYINLDGSGLLGLMDIKSMDSAGFTCIMDDADPSGNMVAYIAFGEPPATGRRRVILIQ